MCERFTRSGRRVVNLAGEEARSLGHKYIGTEHLLLGILREREGVAARALEALGTTPDRVRERVIRTVGSHEAVTTEYRLPLTPRASKVLELALEEALGVGHDYVAPEHILTALAGDSEGVAARVLYELGANPDGVRREVAQIMGDQEKAAGDARRVANLPHATPFRARVEGLLVQARCGVTEGERNAPQPLRVDLCYLYVAGEGNDLLETVDYGALIEGVAGLLEREEFKLLETGVRMVGEHVLSRFPGVREVTVTITKVHVPLARDVSGVSVGFTFSR